MQYEITLIETLKIHSSLKELDINVHYNIYCLHFKEKITLRTFFSGMTKLSKTYNP
jgi:hypothetical protein